MAFWGKIFKKDKKRERRIEKKETGRAEEEKVAAVSTKGGRIIPGIIRSPRITEKTSVAAKENKYVFEVSLRANKPGVKSAVEARYGVDVESINIINTRGKERRRGRQIGWKPGFKKAIVKVKEGQTIETQ